MHLQDFHYYTHRENFSRENIKKMGRNFLLEQNSSELLQEFEFVNFL